MSLNRHNLATTTAAPEPAAAPRFVLARDDGTRAGDINALYNRFTGRNRTAEAYRWEFYQSPAGASMVWTITESASGDVVGHHGIIPTPLVRRGVPVVAGRTENTIVDHPVRHKVFYPGMEKKALTEALQRFAVVYTVRAGALRPLRLRLGYKPVGDWAIYLPKIGPRYLLAMLKRGRAKVAPRVPDVVLAVGARLIAGVHSLAGWLRRHSAPLEIREVAGIGALAGEYERFWQQARERYDLTIDRSLDFLRWRFTDNPHVQFRTWTLRSNGQLVGVVIGHRHAMGRGLALYIDDMIVGDYDDATFGAVLSCLLRLDAEVETVVVMTLAIDTPLHRVLLERFPLQRSLWKWLGRRVFDDMVAIDENGADWNEPWYVTPIFTEGLDTSR